ncbi:MAG: hypothetical protein DRJ64_02965 [Thermoprotei archaeon]|nr:MAG: hypothetical protein DRJ64_02965 [Thermoprotei archaeon]
MEYEELYKKYGKSKVSKIYYLLPIFLGILGGIAGYLLVEDRDKKFAKRLIIIGIIMTFVGVIVVLFFPFLAYLYISQTFRERTSHIEFFDATCSEGNVTIYLMNFGTQTIPASEINCEQIKGNCESTCLPVDLEPNKLTSITIEGCESNQLHVWKIQGPSNSLEVSVFCY